MDVIRENARLLFFAPPSSPFIFGISGSTFIVRFCSIFCPKSYMLEIEGVWIKIRLLGICVIRRQAGRAVEHPQWGNFKYNTGHIDIYS